MNCKVAVYGMAESQTSLVMSILPDEYTLYFSETVTDLLVSDAVCCIINAETLDKNSIGILQNYYFDAGDYVSERTIWIGEPLLCNAFFYYSSFSEMLANFGKILRNAQQRYEIRSMFCCEYALLPARFIADGLEQDVLDLLHQKYGENPNPIILKRMRQEWTALLETDAVSELAAVYELTLWLKKMGHPYWIGGCVPSGFVPHLLEITRVNPLPSEQGGHNLVWQEFCSYGRSPYYDIHLCADLQPRILDWLRDHWLGKLNHYEWKILQPYESRCILRGNMHLLFDLDEEQNQAAEEIPTLCREDIFFYLKKHGFVDKDAFRGMCSVRKGRGIPVITDEMRTAEDNWILKMCENVKWLSSRAVLLEKMIFYKNYGS